MAPATKNVINLNLNVPLCDSNRESLFGQVLFIMLFRTKILSLFFAFFKDWLLFETQTNFSRIYEMKV